MSPATLSAKKHSRILVAGADPAQRAAVLHDLSESLPEGAQLGEAGAVSEVLERAPASSVVMFAGDLDEVSAESLMQHARQPPPQPPGRGAGPLAAQRRPRGATARLVSLRRARNPPSRPGEALPSTQPLAWRRVDAAHLPPAAEDPGRLHGQPAGHLVRHRRSVAGHLRPHPQRAGGHGAVCSPGRPCQRSWCLRWWPASRLSTRSDLSALYAFEAVATAALAVLLWHFLLPAMLVLVALDGTAALAASALLRAEAARAGREEVERSWRPRADGARGGARRTGAAGRAPQRRGRRSGG